MNRKVRKPIIALTLLVVLASIASHAAAEQEKTYVNVDKKGLALQGYDPVAYFTQNKPVKGDERLTSTFQGATYRFASSEHKATFDADPAKYAPQFGGFCAYAVSKGYTAKIDPEAFQIVDGRLLLQYDKGVRETFNKDTPGNLKKADANWPKIVEKKAK